MTSHTDKGASYCLYSETRTESVSSVGLDCTHIFNKPDKCVTKSLLLIRRQPPVVPQKRGCLLMGRHADYELIMNLFVLLRL